MKTLIMKIPTIALVAFALCAPVFAGEEAHEGHDHGGADLEEAMEEMGGQFKKLTRAMRAPDAADLATYQAQAAAIKKQAVKARELVPTLAEEAGDGKDAMVAAYRKSIGEFIVLAEQLEKALAEGDLDKAQSLVTKLNAARKQGHKDFKKPDDD